MKLSIISTSATLILSSIALSGCTSDNLCEDILEVKKQNHQCEVLAKAMREPKNPQAALTARTRYENECINMRYYRNGYDTICKKGETPIDES
jgi:hypothetical protein